MTGKNHIDNAADASFALTLFRALAILLSCGIALSVAIGLRGVLSEDGGLSGWIIPIAVSAVLGAVLAGLWHVALGMAQRVRGGDTAAFWTTIGVAVALTAVQAATSMPFLASAIGGHTAVRHHQERVLNALDSAVNAVAGVQAEQAAMDAAFGREADRLTGLRNDEIAGRGPSGQAGDGPVASMIAAAISELLRAGEGRKADAGQVDRLLKSARGAIALSRDASRAGNEAGFVGAVSAARAALVEAMEAVAAGNGGFSFSAASLPQIQAAQDRLNAVTRNLAARGLPLRLPEYEALSRPAAVLTYPEAVPLAWSVAVAVDALALVMLLVLLFSRRVRSEP